ncbi:hypothetical protein BDZ89DRAFT_1126938 [Hymenopellis radicata]|nr:hypothetical protein BDZ89DRAFT_1126938 [Hymenopellis radicata]
MFNLFKLVATRGQRLHSTSSCGPSLKYRPLEIGNRSPGSRVDEACKARLEELFVQNQRPDFDTVNQLAVEFDESYDTIWFWFRNRRPNPPPRNPLREELEAVYSKERYPKREALETLAEACNEEYSAVYNWFVRRRKQERTLEGPEGEVAEHNPGLVPRIYRLSDASREVLDDYFKKDQHPRRPALLQLSVELGETYETVYRYFVRRRHQKKSRKLQLEHHKMSIECKEAMEALYLKEEYPTKEVLKTLAKTWNTEYSLLYNWFNRRRKRAEVREAEGPAEMPESAPTKARLSDAALKVLDAHFEKDPYPRRPALAQLSIELDRSYETLYRYFTWRRYKSRQRATDAAKRGRPKVDSQSQRAADVPRLKNY